TRRSSDLERVPQVLPEQRVERKRTRCLITFDEQCQLLQMSQMLLCRDDIERVVAQGRRKRLEEGGLNQKMPKILWQAPHQTITQTVEYIWPDQRGIQRSTLGLVVQTQLRQFDRRRPPPGQLMQAVGVALGGLRAGVAQILQYLLRRKE